MRDFLKMSEMSVITTEMQAKMSAPTVQGNVIKDKLTVV
jgi:hypothetical protein